MQNTKTVKNMKFFKNCS